MVTRHDHASVIDWFKGILVVCIDPSPSVMCDDSVLTVSQEYCESCLIDFLES